MLYILTQDRMLHGMDVFRVQYAADSLNEVYVRVQLCLYRRLHDCFNMVVGVFDVDARIMSSLVGLKKRAAMCVFRNRLSCGASLR